MRTLFLIFSLALFFGCSSTWQGMQEDAQDMKSWTKEKVNSAASYIKEKTE